MEVNKSHLEWLASNDTGTSSKTMLSAITGIPTTNRPDIPYDIADVGRCIRMLKRLPDLRDKLQLVIDNHIEWMPFIDCWQQLERDYYECLEFEKLSPIEQKKIIKKRGESPNQSYWKLMCELVTASRYLRGMRMQGSKNSWSNQKPKNY